MALIVNFEGDKFSKGVFPFLDTARFYQVGFSVVVIVLIYLFPIL